MNGLNVYPIVVENELMPWIEICKNELDGETDPHNIIIIEPTIGKDPLDFDNDDTPAIYGNYDIDIIDDEYSCDTISVIKLNIASLKKSASMKHISMSTFIAVSDFLHHINDYNINESNYFPYIIINTKCDVAIAPLKSFSEIIREVASAYINHYGELPIIFVAFSNNYTLTSDHNYKKKKKKKKK